MTYLLEQHTSRAPKTRLTHSNSSNSRALQVTAGMMLPCHTVFVGSKTCCSCLHALSRNKHISAVIAVLPTLLTAGLSVGGGGGGVNMDSITSSTDEFLDLPAPPSTVPPEGSTGLLPPAAAAGPRFKPGSRVWCGCGGSPEEGTVGMVLSLAGGPGGQAVYKVRVWTGEAAESSAFSL